MYINWTLNTFGPLEFTLNFVKHIVSPHLAPTFATILHPPIVLLLSEVFNNVTSWAPMGCNIFCYSRVGISGHKLGIFIREIQLPRRGCMVQNDLTLTILGHSLVTTFELFSIRLIKPLPRKIQKHLESNPGHQIIFTLYFSSFIWNGPVWLL